MRNIIVKVRTNTKTGQKSVTVPKEAEQINDGDYVTLIKIEDENEKDEMVNATLTKFEMLVGQCRTLDYGQYYLPVMNKLKELADTFLINGKVNKKVKISVVKSKLGKKDTK